MSANATATQEDAQKSWEECKAIHGKIRRLTFAGDLGPAVLTADLAHNLTLIQAYAALGVALLYKLGRPLSMQRKSLKWQRVRLLPVLEIRFRRYAVPLRRGSQSIKVTRRFNCPHLEES